MKLTRAADYAIRLLAYLAANRVESTNLKLSDELGISHNHLARVINLLSRNKYLITRKGKNGGVRLAVDPKKIKVSDIVEVIEGPIILSDCIFHREACKFSKTCKFRKCLISLKNNIDNVLSVTTIHDLVPA